MDTKTANDLLQQEPTKGLIDPARLKYFIIAPPKFGKTTTACSIPDSILLAFEEGHAFVETFKIIIDQWDRPLKEKNEGIGQDEDGNSHMSMAEAVQLICASDRFNHVIIDTADMAARMCTDYWCAQYKVKHPADAGDFGKGFALTLTDPFRRMIGQIIKSGRGITFTSHAKFVERQVGQTKTAKWESTLPSQAQAFIHSQVDLIWFGQFGKLRPGMDERDRIISMDASQEVMAGSRVRFDGKPYPMPKKFILDPDNGWEQWASFFPVEGERTKEEAIANCEAAYQSFLDLAVGTKQREKEEVAATAVEAPPPEQSPAKVGGEPEDEPTPDHLTTPKRVTRRKPVSA